MFKDYLQKKQGYTKAETDELDAFMKKEYGEAWTKQERSKPLGEKSRWERFKEWAAWVWTGKKKEEYQSEYDQYKEKLSTLKTELAGQTLSDGVTTLTIDDTFAGQNSQPKRGLSPKQKKLIMLIGVVAVVVLFAAVIHQRGKRKYK